MEIETASCSQCGHETDVCGECGSSHVTPVEHIAGDVERPHAGVRRSVLDATDGDTLEVVQVCWDCGAECRRTLQVSVEHDPGTGT